MDQNLLLAVDVGTASARAGVLSATGELLARAECPIEMRRFGTRLAEQNSEQIWQAVCLAVRTAMAQANAKPHNVVALGFDATCSLVVRDGDGAPLPVSGGVEPHWDTIVWFDHRAHMEAKECTATRHKSLLDVGGIMSPEMEVPKLMWLKRHVPATWAHARQIFDLADFLSWRATGANARSQSTLACKWNYVPQNSTPWPNGFVTEIGLEDLFEKAGLPPQATPVGAPLGRLTEEAAQALGLTQNCVVGAGLIDAHAGALGVLGQFAQDAPGIDRHLALIAGTSNCVVGLSHDRRPIDGIWGPYFGAVLPQIWLNEGGQSASGALLDHLIRWHSAGGEPDAALHARIESRIAELQLVEGSGFAARLHLLPDFHGNRSPYADASALGVISGLNLDSDFDSLCRLYWRGAVAIALGIRQILEPLGQNGYGTQTLHLAGGHTRSPMLMQLYADATGATIIEPQNYDATLLGAGMIAAAAAGLYPSLVEAATAMAKPGKERRPSTESAAQLAKDYRIFCEMQRQRQTLAEMIAEA